MSDDAFTIRITSFWLVGEALGSFLQAKTNQGQWIVRIEDIAPEKSTRRKSLVLNKVYTFELQWDSQVQYQSTLLIFN